jgi:hypothetical protein
MIDPALMESLRDSVKAKEVAVNHSNKPQSGSINISVIFRRFLAPLRMT